MQDLWMWIEKSNFRISHIHILLIFFQSIEDRLEAINAEAAETSRYFPH